MLSANKIIQVCLILSCVSSLPLTERDEITERTVKTFLDGMHEKLEHEGEKRQYTWDCLGSLKVKFSDTRGSEEEGSEKKECDGLLKTIFYVSSMELNSDRKFNKCTTFFEKMEVYRAKTAKTVWKKQHKPISDFLKKCYNIKQIEQQHDNASKWLAHNASEHDK